VSCSVNLVPKARLHARIRARRRLAWIGSCSVLAMLLSTAWGAERTASGALTRLAESVGVVEVQRTEVQRRLVLATARRTRLLEQLQSLTAARRPQPWARRLVTLTREAPDGVFLTTIQIGAPASEGDRAPAGASPAAPSPARKEPPASSTTPEYQTVRLLGYALDHGALLQFLNTLQGLPGWRHVELVRAAQEPFRTGQAVMFELVGDVEECGDTERTGEAKRLAPQPTEERAP
jgi:hypothetical protein